MAGEYLLQGVEVLPSSQVFSNTGESRAAQRCGRTLSAWLYSNAGVIARTFQSSASSNSGESDPRAASVMAGYYLLVSKS